MAILILYTDVRSDPLELVSKLLDWQPQLTAFQAIALGLGSAKAETIQADLAKNSSELIVAWHNQATDDICEMGGVGSLEWEVEDTMSISISYMDEDLSEELFNKYCEWCEWVDETYKDLRAK